MSDLPCPLPDYYAVLGVEREASTTTIKQAFRKLSMTQHPDRAGDSPEIHDKYVRTVEAYLVLSDFNNRLFYDCTWSAYHLTVNFQLWLQNGGNTQIEAAVERQRQEQEKATEKIEDRAAAARRKKLKADDAAAAAAASFAALRNELDLWKKRYETPVKRNEDIDDSTNYIEVETANPPSPPPTSDAPTSVETQEREDKFASLLTIHGHLSAQLDLLSGGPRRPQKALKELEAVYAQLGRYAPSDEAPRTEMSHWFKNKAALRLEHLARDVENLAIAIARTRASTAASAAATPTPPAAYGDPDADAGATDADADADGRSDPGSTGSLHPDTIYGLYAGLAYNIERLQARIDAAWQAIEELWKLSEEMKLSSSESDNEKLIKDMCGEFRKWLASGRK